MCLCVCVCAKLEKIMKVIRRRAHTMKSKLRNEGEIVACVCVCDSSNFPDGLHYSRWGYYSENKSFNYC